MGDSAQTGASSRPAWGGSRPGFGSGRPSSSSGTGASSRSGSASSAQGSSGPSPVTRPVSRISQPQTAPREDFVPSSVLDMKEGQRVEHSKFGYGRIITLEREGASIKAKVLFDDYGEKLLLLQYAKLRIVTE